MSYSCTDCGKKYKKWFWKCNTCGGFNTAEEYLEESEELTFDKKTRKEKKEYKPNIVNLNDIKESTEKEERIKIGFEDLDKTFGGWIMHGSVILISGEPGIGKSTFLLQLGSWLKDKKILYASGEESQAQIGNRAKRVGYSDLNILFSNSLEEILTAIREVKPDIFILDSIQTVGSDKLESPVGSPAQDKYVLHSIVEYSKKFNVTSFVVGHITKDGNIGGAKRLEHLVDTVMYLEGDGGRTSIFKTLKCLKNRYGSTNEITCFEMEQEGLKVISSTEAAKYFISESTTNLPGSALGVVENGKQIFLTEVQCLMDQTLFAFPNRIITGYDKNKFNILLTVLRTKFRMPKASKAPAIENKDIYINIENALDKNHKSPLSLAIIASMMSFLLKKPLGNTIFLGNVGLQGEIRSVPNQKNTIQKLNNIGFDSIISSDNIKNLEDLGEKLMELKI